ncbi:cytochrome c [Desulfococcus sp.]|uniref:c-type cytochrome n=1 Tax=Desulfococcus sp. TaxID=2025834 RepID=UPI0035947AAA
MICRLFMILVCALATVACNDWRMWDTPAVKPHEEPLLIMDEQTVPLEADAEAPYRLADGKTLVSPVAEGKPDTIEAGRTGYLTYCAQCHGKTHDGNGTVGQSFAPLPTDLRSDKVQAQTHGEIFKTISYGTANGRQPALATTIEVPERWAIAVYIKSLGVR